MASYAALRKTLVAELPADLPERSRWPTPLEIGDVLRKRHVVAQGRQAAVEEGLLAVDREALHEPGRAAERQTETAGVLRENLADTPASSRTMSRRRSELDHGPDHHAERGDGALREGELIQQLRVDLEDL